MVKKIYILLMVFTTVFSIATLTNFRQQFDKLIDAHKGGDTSLAFSIAMKSYLALEIFKQQSQIVSPQSLFTTQQQTCQTALSEAVSILTAQNWVENFQQVTNRFQFLQQHCTNSDFSHKFDGSLKGGFENQCALCVVILQVMENYISYHNRNVADFILKQLCTLFDGVMKPTCQAFVHYAGPIIIEQFLKKQTADVICLKLGRCKNPNCKISSTRAKELKEEIIMDTKPAPWQWLHHIFVDKFGDGHLPPFDLDNDTFSDISTFRGYNWRGADCNEMNAKIYPGRKTGSDILDHDCNGIYGLSLKGKSFQQLYCSQKNTKSKRFGIAVIGDSAGAHFSIPQKYLNASMIGKGTYKDLLVRVADQLDIPHESGYTGHVNTPYQSHSVYKFLRNWNLCNHNDYQNTGVNGGDAGNSEGNIKAVTRDQKNDYPLLMFMELIGNDGCKKSFDSMTKPEQFRTRILKLLNWLDNRVPQGSHLMIFGLGDGQLLYDNLHNQTHPLNVTYSQVYDFLNCLKISPCWGWLNDNETVRHFTTQRAQNLSKVYQQIIDSGIKFKNFDMVYYDFPAMQILQRKARQGGDPKKMIERCDGFHPNVEFNSYLADWIWFKLQTEHLDWIGEQNPFNQQIRKQFGHSIII